MKNEFSVSPSAKRLTRSLRDVGYSFESAIADLVDNSIAASATAIFVQMNFEGVHSTITVSDNGTGMDSNQIEEAMRFGSKRNYSFNELGRYGLGLKTASLSQCRRLTVETITDSSLEPLALTLDLDFIEATDQWAILNNSEELSIEDLHRAVHGTHGTRVIWSKLDRVLPTKSADGGWARRRFQRLEQTLVTHLGMVFHRFLDPSYVNPVRIYVNGSEVAPWDPFAISECKTIEYSSSSFEILHEETAGVVALKTYILPSRDDFSSSSAFENAAGPSKWNKQQGLYIYRANRLVQWGGWSGIRAIDEHTKFARARLDFDTNLDEAFNINVAKMRVTIPSELRKMLARPINELCIAASTTYRKSNQRDTPRAEFALDSIDARSFENLGISLKSAALRTGHYNALEDIARLMKKESPEVVKLLGL